MLNKLVLWTGKKHSGKTTAALELVQHLQQQGFIAAGILAPSVYDDGELLGYDIIAVMKNIRMPLSVRDEQSNNCVPYRYFHNALKLGRSALDPDNNKSADLVIIDEYGPMELSGKGWRPDADRLLMANNTPILMVVRWSVVEQVKKLYEKYINVSLKAIDPNSINRVLTLLSHRSTSNKNFYP